MTLSRQRHHDAQRIKQGWRRVPVWLDPEAVAALAALQLQRPDISAQATIRDAVKVYAEIAK